MYARKNTCHEYEVWIEKSVTRDHSSASLGKARDAEKGVSRWLVG